MAVVNPYLNFNGNCEEAFNFYRSVFGGEFLTMMRFGEMPEEHQSIGENQKILHIVLPIGKGTVLMGSDRPAAYGPGSMGENYTVAINAESEEEAAHLFDGLSSGGRVTIPLSEAFWGALFGMFTDKFGVHWMVNYDSGSSI